MIYVPKRQAPTLTFPFKKSFFLSPPSTKTQNPKFLYLWNLIWIWQWFFCCCFTCNVPTQLVVVHIAIYLAKGIGYFTDFYVCCTYRENSSRHAATNLKVKWLRYGIPWVGEGDASEETGIHFPPSKAYTHRSQVMNKRRKLCFILAVLRALHMQLTLVHFCLLTMKSLGVHWHFWFVLHTKSTP